MSANVMECSRTAPMTGAALSTQGLWKGQPSHLPRGGKQVQGHEGEEGMAGGGNMWKSPEKSLLPSAPLWEMKVLVSIGRPPFLCSVCVWSPHMELLSLSKG